MTNKPDSAAATAPDFAAGAQALGASLNQVWQTLSGVSLPLPALVELQGTYLKQSSDLWNQTLQAQPAPVADRRFAAKEWSASPANALMAQMYLLNARTLMAMAEAAHRQALTGAADKVAAVCVAVVGE